MPVVADFAHIARWTPLTAGSRNSSPQLVAGELSPEDESELDSLRGSQPWVGAEIVSLGGAH